MTRMWWYTPESSYCSVPPEMLRGVNHSCHTIPDGSRTLCLPDLTHGMGHYVTMHTDDMEANQKARVKHSEKVFFLGRIGYRTAFSFKGRL